MIDKSYNQGFGYEKEVVVYYTAPSGREGYDTASKHYCVVAAGLFAHYGADWSPACSIGVLLRLAFSPCIA